MPKCGGKEMVNFFPHRKIVFLWITTYYFYTDKVSKELSSSPKKEEDQNLFSLDMTSGWFQEKIMALLMIKFAF